jgi:hypothetical protein
MIIEDTSVCIVCGKRRIVVATHEEKIGNSVVIYKETICPDPECQKKVEKVLGKELEKRQQSAINQQQRVEERNRQKLNSKINP